MNLQALFKRDGDSRWLELAYRQLA